MEDRSFLLAFLKRRGWEKTGCATDDELGEPGLQSSQTSDRAAGWGLGAMAVAASLKTIQLAVKDNEPINQPVPQSPNELYCTRYGVQDMVSYLHVVPSYRYRLGLKQLRKSMENHSPSLPSASITCPWIVDRERH
ncbi:hypothetical protein VFPPC_17974 [Pochonia chlamydosporia 170]|uniref:Uncharacterized protein n=1 Tax=Pochonia chlamydosporia 170 TaxID=1380566 RepID=A0A219APX3_METCM|nr:hypothetical protein VFPPC_17974 [Pochonia chlamydosporia 170]OWT42833.1 hypothetical protein VFPPC_17974 [Pochonia chlamydosporia 170]